MAPTVLCLRPEGDFARVEALPPPGLHVLYRAPDDPALGDLVKKAIALVIPAVGPKLPVALFESTALRLVQVTAAGVDRLDRAALSDCAFQSSPTYPVEAAALLLNMLSLRPACYCAALCPLTLRSSAATTRVIVRACWRRTCPVWTDCSSGPSASGRSAGRWRRRSKTWGAESDTSTPLRTL